MLKHACPIIYITMQLLKYARFSETQVVDVNSKQIIIIIYPNVFNKKIQHTEIKAK